MCRNNLGTKGLSKLIFYACLIFVIGLNIKAINILYSADEDLGLQELGLPPPLSVV